MRARSLFLYLLIAIFVITIDQVSKSLIQQYLIEGQSVSIIGDFLYFQFIYNSGGAMGTRLGPSWVYLILTIVALLVISRYFWTIRSSGWLEKSALALIFGGAIGNLADRIMYGKVIDFIDMDFPDIPFLNIYRWFTYNIADAAITIGLIIFAAGILIKKKNEPPVTDSAQFPEPANNNSDQT